MNIIVLCGGLSPERDVSITSGRMVKQALRKLGHRAVMLDLFFGYPKVYSDPSEIFDSDIDDDLTAIGESAPDIQALRESVGAEYQSIIGKNVINICRSADIVFMALHGADGENGKLQAAFDLMGIKYTGSGYLGSAMAMNKTIAKEIFAQNGILTPKGITVNKHQKNIPNIGFPCVVKPRSGGSSVGTSIVTKSEDYRNALETAFSCEDEAIVEQYIKGRECDVGVLDGIPLPVIEICPKSGFYDYKNKYQAGLTDEYCPADLDAETSQRLQDTALKVFHALNLEIFSRMDFIVEESGDIYCLEANTLPGMTPVSLLPQEAAAAGISYEELCEKIISASMERYK